MFTTARRDKILAEAHAHLAKKQDRERTSARQPEIVYKRHDDAVVERSAAAASGSEPWWDRVEDYVWRCLHEFAADAGKQTVEWLDEIRREQAILQREIAQLREQVGLERGLKELRSEVEQARAEVPKLPAIVERLEAKHARLSRELETTREKLRAVRVDQSVANFRLRELDKETRKQAANVEMKIETRVAASFAMREMHPDAAAALRDF